MSSFSCWYLITVYIRICDGTTKNGRTHVLWPWIRFAEVGGGGGGTRKRRYENGDTYLTDDLET